MKITLAIFSFTLLSAASWFAYSGFKQPSRDLLVQRAGVTISPNELELGDLSQSEVAKCTFVVTNSGDRSVKVVAINKGCSCSDVTVPPTIPAGNASEMSMLWALRGKRGRSSETVSVIFIDDLGHKSIATVRVTCTAQGIIDVGRETINLSQDAHSDKVTFSSKVGRVFRLIAATTNHASLKSDLLPDGNSVKVSFDVNVAGWDSGQLMVVVYTDQPDEPELRIRVRINKSILTGEK